MAINTDIPNLQVGIKELKDNLSAYLRHVKAGTTLTITEHGQPIGRLVPMPKSVETQLQDLVDAGLIIWNGKKYQPNSRRTRPLLSPNASKTAAELVLEDRT